MNLKLRDRKNYERVNFDVLPSDLKHTLVYDFGIHSNDIDVLQNDEEIYIGIPYTCTIEDTVVTEMAELHLVYCELVSIECRLKAITLREVLEGYARYINLY